MTTPQRPRGALYVATRQAAYVDLALRSAASLRQVAPGVPITLLTDRTDVPDAARALFEEVRIVPSETRDGIGEDWANGLVDKVRGMGQSPYQRTLFIDCDTTVRSAEVVDAFTLLDEHDVLLTLCAEDASQSRRMMGRPIYSSGILAYRQTAAVTALLGQWLDRFLVCLDRIRRDDLTDVADIAHLPRADRRFLLATDQYALAQLLAPDRNPLGLAVAVLDERWNFRGDGKRRPPADVVIDHQLAIKFGRDGQVLQAQDAESPTPAPRAAAFLPDAGAASPTAGEIVGAEATMLTRRLDLGAPGADRDLMISAFASPIMLRRYPQHAALHRTVASSLRRLASAQASHDAHRAHQGGFYTEMDLLQRALPGIAEIAALTRRGIEDYVRAVSGVSATPRIELGAWAAVTRAGDYQTPHVHRGAMLSGIYYVAVPDRPEPEACIDLLNPLDQQEMTFLRGPTRTHTRLKPQAGDLLIFPAYLKHWSHPFQGEGERILVVFNVNVREGPL